MTVWRQDRVRTRPGAVRAAFLLALIGFTSSRAEAQESPAAASAPIRKARAAADEAPESREFVLEALVDFPDDALMAAEPITPQHIDAMMRRLKESGVRRVSWGYYGDGHGGMLCPARYSEGGWKVYAETYRGLGNPLKVAVDAGHRHGLKVFAYFKPYETGPAMIFPEGSPEAGSMGLLPQLGGKLAWLEPFVNAHPELRIRRRTDDLPPGVDTAAVRTIRLEKSDDSPTRITKEHLQIWTSEANWQYRHKPVEYELSDAVEVGKAGRPVRVLTLSGLNLTEKYILVTTDFNGGRADFVNSGLNMMTSLDDEGREIPGAFATGGAVWCAGLQNFRTKGLTFDYGLGGVPVALDVPNVDGRKGIIAFTRGRNEYLPGALCETEPMVQEFWLRCLEEMMDAGVDGVDIREESHSTHTDYPQDYGFNDVILKQCGDATGQALLDKIAEVRGNAYTAFLRQCHERLSSAKLRMRYNLQIDWLRTDRPDKRALAYPAHVDWQWRNWIDSGLIDEAILRFYSYQPDQILADGVTADVLDACKKRNLPVAFNRYLAHAGAKLPGELARVQTDGRFSSFILYETCDFIRFAPNGVCQLGGRPEVVSAIHAISK